MGVLRIRIVIGDRDEIQTARSRRLHAEKDRARNHLATLAGATAIAVRRVHVQVTAIPTSLRHQRSHRKTGILVSCVEADFGAIMGDALCANIRHRDQKMPLSGWNRSRQIGRGRIGLADGEVALVAAALSAKSLRVIYPQIESRALFLSRVLKIHAEAMGTRWHGERDLNIRFALRARNFPCENYVWRGLLLSPPQRREDQ